MIEKGSMIIVDSLYVKSCFYEKYVGRKAWIDSLPHPVVDPYRLKGVHLFYTVQFQDGNYIEIHEKDCILPRELNNRKASLLLEKGGTFLVEKG